MAVEEEEIDKTAEQLAEKSAILEGLTHEQWELVYCAEKLSLSSSDEQ